MVAVLQQTERVWAGTLPQVDDEAPHGRCGRATATGAEKATEGRFQGPRLHHRGDEREPLQGPAHRPPCQAHLVSHSEPRDDIHLWKADNVTAAQRQD